MDVVCENNKRAFVGFNDPFPKHISEYQLEITAQMFLQPYKIFGPYPKDMFNNQDLNNCLNGDYTLNIYKLPKITGNNDITLDGLFHLLRHNFILSDYLPPSTSPISFLKENNDYYNYYYLVNNIPYTSFKQMHKVIYNKKYPLSSFEEELKLDPVEFNSEQKLLSVFFEGGGNDTLLITETPNFFYLFIHCNS